MSQASAPVLTVRAGRSQGSFAAGRDVVVGSDVRADLRVAHPLIGRAHLLLRFDQGRWTAIDNNSLNGMYVNGQRVPTVDIRDGQAVNIGKPDGPRLTFQVGRHDGAVGSLPPTEMHPVIVPPDTGPMSRPHTIPPRKANSAMSHQVRQIPLATMRRSSPVRPGCRGDGECGCRIGSLRDE